MSSIVKVSHEPGRRLHKMIALLSSFVPKGLTDQEIEIIAALKVRGCKLNAEVRKEICEELEISSDYLNNYVKKLRTKGVIVQDGLSTQFEKLEVENESKPQPLAIVFETKAK